MITNTQHNTEEKKENNKEISNITNTQYNTEENKKEISNNINEDNCNKTINEHTIAK